MDSRLLLIENLNLYNRSGTRLVKNVSLSLGPGETLGIVGESGSGKTLTLKSIIGLLPSGIRETCERREINGRCAMVFQSPLTSLDPLYPVFRQLVDVIELQQKLSRREAEDAAKQYLEQLSLPVDLAEKDRYPGELSGGQCQRILIALALACRPDVLLCDEPTTALDVTVQKQVMDLIRRLQQELGFAMIFVTHNLAVASQLCSRIAVMKQGEIIEMGPKEKILRNPADDYTRELVDSVLPVPEVD
ncbi:MAG: ABC transporter ATP-binding protein [Solobacterium sp.]|nr:ABC transporter ATP-binding protein [Solobacterium sp.]